jgi:hypothetical protein
MYLPMYLCVYIYMYLCVYVYIYINIKYIFLNFVTVIKLI